MSMKVEDVMAPAVIVVGPKDTVARVRRIMKVENVHALPVIDAYTRPLGVVTSTDLLPAYPARMRISRVMTSDLVTIGRRASVKAAARLMRTKGIHHLVVTQGGKVVGITSALDLLRLLESPASARSGRARTLRK